jgi:DNA-binding Xre family transcriptional regulator
MKTWIRLDDLMAQPGLTLKEVATRTGLSPRHLHRLRRGDVRYLRLGTVNKLARGLEVTSISDLIACEPDLKEREP